MSAQPEKDQSTDAQIPRAKPDDLDESGTIHPITWMAIGGGLIGVAVTFAVIFGFFDRQKSADAAIPAADHNSAIVATTESAKPDTGNWWDKLVDESAGKSTSSPAVKNSQASPANPSVTVDEKKEWKGDPIAATPAPADQQKTVKQIPPEELYERVVPSVVTIKVKSNYGEHVATGSGFFVDKELVDERYENSEFFKTIAERSLQKGKHTKYGYVLTNYHVIRPAVSADVILFNGDEGTAQEVVSEDEKADLALLCVMVKTRQTINALPIAENDPRVLSTVFAIGSPKGLRGSASEGRVSGFRELAKGERWLQTTAPISPGSSGGPLLTTEGTVAGVTTLSFKDAQNLNFAVPASKVREFLLSQYHPRDIAEGASISWHEEHAFIKMNAILNARNSSYSSDAKNSGTLLERARKEIDEAVVEKDYKRIARYQQAIALSQQAEAALPSEFKYLFHYLLGEANCWLAIRNSSGDTNQTEAQRQANYRNSREAGIGSSHLVECTRLAPEFSPAFRLLWLHYSTAGNAAEALRVSDRTVKLMPRCAEALSDRASCYDKLGRYESAKKDLESAIELAPHSGSLHDALSGVFLSLDDHARAIASAENALADKEYPAAGVHVNLGLMYRRVGQYQKAISHFEKAKSTGWPSDYCDREIAKCKRLQP